TPRPDATRIWLAPAVPSALADAFTPLLSTGSFTLADEATAQVKVQASLSSEASLSSQWIYAPVAAFPTIADDVKWSDVQRYWQGDGAALAYLSGNSQPPVFVADSATVAALTMLLGLPAPTVKIDQVAPEAVAPTLWLHRPAAWGIVPFDQLDPAMKVLTLDSRDVFKRDLDLGGYPLEQHFSLSGDPARVAATTNAVKTAGSWQATNRDLSKMTILVMTGTTAMTRATAYRMETEGITYPARDIAPFMADADFVHVSNEVAFATDCPYPNPNYTEGTDMKFCSKDSYFDLLNSIHANIIELTGNHEEDWGPDALNHTLDLYDSHHLPYFGGGRNASDARKALIVNNDGNTIAFIGCNPVGPEGDWATDTYPGAAKCDDAFLAQEIPRLKSVANVVIMTLQYVEYYQYDAPDDQVQYFHKFADLGADLVMGSQGHWAQGFAFTDHTFIHYGVGNLFFDQMDQPGTRQMFADKIIIYRGKHIGTVLFTGLLEDYARPRPMTSDERASLLQTIFKASGW
ncbi:MAG TPA: CapA family protein, partial [Aggregatilineales bacterium]|nr:CapA family protein [Aggregatilineales bacterium]